MVPGDTPGVTRVSICAVASGSKRKRTDGVSGPYLAHKRPPYAWHLIACVVVGRAQEETTALRLKLKQLSAELEAEVESNKRAAKCHADELAQREADLRKEMNVAEDKFRAELEKARLDAVSLGWEGTVCVLRSPAK